MRETTQARAPGCCLNICLCSQRSVTQIRARGHFPGVQYVPRKCVREQQCAEELLPGLGASAEDASDGLVENYSIAANCTGAD
jgi:hypothetical protein